MKSLVVRVMRYGTRTLLTPSDSSHYSHQENRDQQDHDSRTFLNVATHVAFSELPFISIEFSLYCSKKKLAMELGQKSVHVFKNFESLLHVDRCNEETSQWISNTRNRGY